MRQEGGVALAHRGPCLGSFEVVYFAALREGALLAPVQVAKIPRVPKRVLPNLWCLLANFPLVWRRLLPNELHLDVTFLLSDGPEERIKKRVRDTCG